MESLYIVNFGRPKVQYLCQMRGLDLFTPRQIQDAVKRAPIN